MDVRLLILSFLLCLCSSSEVQPVQYPVGDIRNCPTNQLQDPNATLMRMNVLPGLGFDNLRNLDVGRVYNISYSGCQISNDGLYILPDGINVEPVLNSEVDYSAEVYSHFDEHKSSIATSINFEAKYSNSFSQVSGKFSTDYLSTKSKMVTSNSRSVRVGLRHHVYSVHIDPDTGLNPSFKSRILDIAANIQNNNTELAHYLTDLLIRDYGTHVVTSVELGAALYQTTFVAKDSSEETESSTLNISASAGASFFSTFSIESKFQFSKSHVNSEGFSRSTTHSHTSTHGGPPFRLSNFSYTDWENGMLNNLVAIDRRGVPLFSAISTSNIPELPDVLLLRTVQYMYKAVKKYYQINTHYGCTDPGSANFNFQANVDDESCAMNRQNHTFGGIYQTCDSPSVQNCNDDNDHNNCDVCETLSARQTNPLTNAYSCPSGYYPILLHTGTLTNPVTVDDCHEKCAFLGIFCHTVCQKKDKINYGFYKAYWCVFPPNTTVPPDSGYMFGGAYTSRQQNPITGSQSCPMSFYPLHFGEDIEVCVSNDIEGAPQSLPFGGFTSCTQGNPLSATSSQFKKNVYPHRCPCQYNQFFLTEDQGCVVNYCSEVMALRRQKPHPPLLPPYKVKASLSVNVSNTLVLTGPYGTVWVKGLNGEWQQYTEGSYGTGDDYIRSVYAQSINPTDSSGGDIVIQQITGAIIGTFVSTLILVVLVVVIVFGLVKLRRRMKVRKSLQPYYDLEDSFDRSEMVDTGPQRDSALINELRTRIESKNNN